ncbi:MAG: hypothetical protein ACI3W8_07445 [Oscillospiraceae bacterium]
MVWFYLRTRDVIDGRERWVRNMDGRPCRYISREAAELIARGLTKLPREVRVVEIDDEFEEVCADVPFRFE